MPDKTLKQLKNEHKEQVTALEKQEKAELKGVNDAKVISEIMIRYARLKVEMASRHEDEKNQLGK